MVPHRLVPERLYGLVRRPQVIGDEMDLPGLGVVDSPCGLLRAVLDHLVAQIPRERGVVLMHLDVREVGSGPHAGVPDGHAHDALDLGAFQPRPRPLAACVQRRQALLAGPRLQRIDQVLDGRVDGRPFFLRVRIALVRRGAVAITLHPVNQVLTLRPRLAQLVEHEGLERARPHLGRPGPVALGA